ncbi:MAG: hypothetical protein ACK6DS_11875, partial [Planctomycetota bacterium]
KTDQQGDTCTFTYNLAGQLLSRAYRTAANSPSGTVADSDTFTYDRAARMLKRKRCQEPKSEFCRNGS